MNRTLGPRHWASTLGAFALIVAACGGTAAPSASTGMARPPR